MRRWVATSGHPAPPSPPGLEINLTPPRAAGASLGYPHWVGGDSSWLGERLETYNFVLPFLFLPLLPCAATTVSQVSLGKVKLRLLVRRRANSFSRLVRLTYLFSNLAAHWSLPKEKKFFYADIPQTLI